MKGWQLVADNNSAKSVGTQIAYASSRFSAALNTMAGAELPDDAVHLRRFVDLIATWKTTPKLSIGASLDRGRQALPGGAAANWLGVGGYARYELSDGRAVALRAEHFRDPDGGISGTAQRLDEGTLTYELRPQKHLILKFEGRHDRSSAPVFDGASTQTLVIGSAVAHF